MVYHNLAKDLVRNPAWTRAWICVTIHVDSSRPQCGPHCGNLVHAVARKFPHWKYSTLPATVARYMLNLPARITSRMTATLLPQPLDDFLMGSTGICQGPCQRPCQRPCQGPCKKSCHDSCHDMLILPDRITSRMTATLLLQSPDSFDIGSTGHR